MGDVFSRVLRQRQTPAEAAFWEFVRDRRLGGYKFRRQHPIDRFVADFCCPDKMLVVEIDGSFHDDRQEADAQRTAVLSKHGYRVIRFTNRDVEKNQDYVVSKLLSALEE